MMVTLHCDNHNILKPFLFYKTTLTMHGHFCFFVELQGRRREKNEDIYTVTDLTHWHGRSVFWVAAL